MKNVVKCHKCGKVHQLTKKTMKKDFECTHCHAQMKLDKKTLRRAAFWRYALMMIASLLMVITLNLLGMTRMLYLLLCAIALGIPLSFFLEDFSLLVVGKINGLNYEPVVKVAETKKKK